MTLGELIRGAAAVAGHEKPGNAAAAGRLLVAKCNSLGLRPPKNPAGYVKYWQGRVTKDGKLLSHAHQSGRKPKLTTAQVEAAYTAIMGWEAAGRARPYESARDIATKCAYVKQLLAKTGAKVETLISRIQALHPRFGREKLRARWVMSDDIMQERLAKALQLKAMDESELQKVIHLDAKTVHMEETSIYGYVDLAVGYTISAIRPARKRGKTIKVKYYAAVNAKLGAFFIRFYTGTTDMPGTRHGLNYKVSSGLEDHGCAPSHHM